ncbi:MAG TPA: hypothetical protein VK437_01165 [Steroidobacteraceae bacterium]|nr:hypothetical protein [Steroidobacteraceae bacterium]
MSQHVKTLTLAVLLLSAAAPAEEDPNLTWGKATIAKLSQQLRTCP